MHWVVLCSNGHAYKSEQGPKQLTLFGETAIEGDPVLYGSGGEHMPDTDDALWH